MFGSKFETVIKYNNYAISIPVVKLAAIQFVVLMLIFLSEIHVLFALIIIPSIYYRSVLRERVLYVYLTVATAYFDYFLRMAAGLNYDKENITIIIGSGAIFMFGFFLGSILKSKIGYGWTLIFTRTKIFNNYFLLTMTLILTISGYWGYFGRGLNKREMLVEAGFEYYMMLFLLVVSVIDIYHSKRVALKLIGYFICFAGVMLIAGERDLIVKWLVIVFFIFWLVKNALSEKQVVSTFMGVILFLVFSHYLKGLLSWGGYSMMDDVGMAIFFDNDLSVSGRNFYYLLSSGLGDRIDYNVIIADLSRFLNIGGISATNYFNDQIYSDVGSQRGFSLFAELYFSVGYVGLAVFGLLFGLLSTRYLVMRNDENLMRVIISSSLLFAFAYGTRSDLANILSIFIKQSLVIYVAVALVFYVFGMVSIKRLKNDWAQ